MKISYNWLKEYVDINVSPEKLAELLTMHSFEVENVIYQGKSLEGVVVGEVLEKKKHPDADKLSVVRVKAGKSRILEIVCGAPNINVGQKVPVALVGTILPGGMKIEKRKVRGIESSGMVCAEDELGLGEGHEGIMVLDENLQAGVPIKDVLGLDDVVFEIDILPNRAHDCLSHIGVAREAAAITKSKIKNQKSKLQVKIAKINNFLSVKIEDKKLCRRYSAAVVNNIEIKESPQWLKGRLQGCDVRPINNIVDITNYVMLSLGQPMHAFDADKLKGKIIIRNAKKGENILALDDKTYELTEDDLVIADEERPIAIAGVMGGKDTAVDENTKNIIFESANFEGSGIRKTSQKLKLSSESSYRFEREIDPELTIKAIEAAVNLAKELAGGYVQEKIIDIYSKQAKPKEIEFSFGRIENLLGIAVAEKKISEILNSLGFQVLHKRKKVRVKIPTYRLDIDKVNDVIEEIGRIYGYKNIPEIPAMVGMKSVTQDEKIVIKKKIKEILCGLGLTEAYNYSFASEKDIENIGLNAKEHIELENPLSEEHRFLKSSLLSGLLKNANLNLKYKNEFGIFEIGKVYLKNKNQLPKEKEILSGIIVGTGSGEKLFFHAKGKIEILCEKLGIETEFGEMDRSEAEPYWHKARSAKITSRGNVAGKIGEISPVVLDSFEIDSRVLYFEIPIEALAISSVKEKKYSQLNRFPKAELDLSVIFDEKAKWSEIEKTIKNTGGELVRKVEPFDLYRGKELGENKKSIAFRITYQADDRTLKEEEVLEIQNKIIKEMEKLGGKIRK